MFVFEELENGRLKFHKEGNIKPPSGSEYVSNPNTGIGYWKRISFDITALVP